MGMMGYAYWQPKKEGPDRFGAFRYIRRERRLDMTIDKSAQKSSPDPTMDTVQRLLARARKAVVQHDAKVIIKRIQAMRAKRFPSIKKVPEGRRQIRVRAQRTPASHKTDSGGSTDPDPEPPRPRKCRNSGGAL